MAPAPAPGNSAPPPVPPVAQTFVVEGAVQKGPFIVGSTVLVNRLDSRGQSLSSTLVTQIEDSIGSFSFQIAEQGPVQIVATGYYFSELTGQLSQGMLSLRALYDVNGGATQNAHVNILTHLIHDRVLALIADGTRTVRSAIAQAEDEFTAAFIDALPVADLTEFAALSLYDMGQSQSDDLGNTYLLALSTAFYKYAEIKAREFGTATDAELTLILNQVSADLAADGDLDSRQQFIPAFVTAIRSLSPTVIAANLRSRSLVDYPQGLDVPDISRLLGLCAGNFACAWSAGTPAAVGVHGGVAVYGGKIYVFGGVGANVEAGATREYDPVLNVWTAKAAMPQPAEALDAHTIGDHIYVVTGYGPDGFRNDLYRYDPRANTWSVRTPRPTYRSAFASAAVGGKIYVIGGQGIWDDGPWRTGENWTLKNHVEIYDPDTNTWSAGTPLATAIAEPRPCVFGDTIYLFGGRTTFGEPAETSILTYDTTSASWSARAPMPLLRREFACVVVDDAAYLLGGFVAGQLTDLVQRYDPFVETWSLPTRLPTVRSRPAVTAIEERIFTFGGEAAGGVTYLLGVEIFDTGFEGP